MSAAPFHLAWFPQGSSIQAWGESWTGNISDDWMSRDMLLDLARGCERAGMDYILLDKANPRFIVTSLKPAEIDGRRLYEKVYCARGEMENRIKECQLDLFADRTSAATMRAN